MPELVPSSVPIQRDFRLASLDEALIELEKLRKASQVLISPGWDMPHILNHCTRSLAFTMQGYPEMKNGIFRATVGQMAFHVFDLRGYMSHDLNEEIPGSAPPAKQVSLDLALTNLEDTIHAFQHFKGPLQPHFAYGALTKSQFDRANALHIANHFSALEY